MKYVQNEKKTNSLYRMTLMLRQELFMVQRHPTT